MTVAASTTLSQQEAEWARRAHEAQAAAAQAYARLLNLAESSDSGQAGRVAEFLAGTFVGRPYDLFDLRTLDVSISDDILTCVDALRWAKADLYKLVPYGEQRLITVLMAHGLIGVTR